MKNHAAAPNLAGASEQELPAPPAMFVVPQEATRGAPRARASHLPADGSAFVPGLTVPAARSLETAESAPSAIFALPAASEWQARQLDRAHDMIAVQAVRLRQSGNDTLRVVIKPGAGTELALELSLREGVIEASARLQQGDVAFFQQHWPELQQRLEARGVRLGALSADASLAGGADAFSQPRRRSPENDALAASAFAEWVLAGNRAVKVGQPRPVRPAYRGWQSWA